MRAARRPVCAALLALGWVAPATWAHEGGALPGPVATAVTTTVIAAPLPTPQASTPSANPPRPPPAAQPLAPRRPRIGLVLSGGGARGLAHVGVLKVLEQLQVPIDVIAGTSMGAIVGGLYASGMRAEEMERELLAVRWSEVFAPRIERRHLSQRRKEEDFEISPLLELGLRDGELRTPQGAVSSRGLESLLRRYTLPVRKIQSFDALPIPFRAVSTDMETGRAVIMDGGDLALALRSSMSVPGVFAPIEIDDHILGDGGLVNNTPVDVARALGAEIVIVSNIGTPLAGRQTLNSVLGLTEQMINILTEQNVQRSLATLTPRDVLIAPELGTLTSADFARVEQLIGLGMAGARGRSDRLAALSLGEAAYAQWRQAHRAPPPPGEPRIAFVRIEGSTATNPERLKPMLESRPGLPFDAARAERDAQRLAGGGDYTRADYQLVTDAVHGDGLVFELEDKSWGPNYLRVGLDLSTDFRGRSAFNLKLSHNRHWLTPSGTEWRNRLQIGEVPLLASELYHPLAWSTSRADDWFISAHAGSERRSLRRYEPDSGEQLASYRRDAFVAGIDIGQPWGEFGEMRFGLSQLRLRSVPELVRLDYQGATDSQRWRETGLRARVVVDQLDYPSFPQQGYRAEAELWHGRRHGGDASEGRLVRLEAQGLWAFSRGADSFNLFALVQMADQPPGAGIGRYQLGGFHQLSGYQPGQLAGNQVLLLRGTWYRRMADTPSLTRGFFVGGSLEVGNAWDRIGHIRLTGLRSGMSLFLGADTGMGPLYLGLTYAPRGGGTGLILFIGRP